MKYKISVIIAVWLLLLCMWLYFVPSLKGDSSENRTLATFHMVLYPETESVVYHEDMVERLDAALADQFPFREVLVRNYLNFSNKVEKLSLLFAGLLYKQNDDQHVLHALGNYEEIDDTGYITVMPSQQSMDASVLNNRVDQFNYIHSKYPEIKLYTYYVTQAYDMPWFDSYLGTTTADHFMEMVSAFPDYVRKSHLEYENLSDYMDTHYKTDHHWNHRGSRRGYEDVYAMMSDDIELGKILVPIGENEVSKKYNFDYIGSYGNKLGNLYKKRYDSFSFYEYEFPKREMSVIDPNTFQEISVDEIGLYDEYQKGEIELKETDHYIKLYGMARDSMGDEYQDSAYLFFVRNSAGNGMNLLLTGDSYNRAMRDTLASHFDTTIYFDYRIYDRVSIDDIIDKYNINVVLMSGCSGYWDSEDYLFMIREDE